MDARRRRPRRWRKNIGCKSDRPRSLCWRRRWTRLLCKRRWLWMLREVIPGSIARESLHNDVFPRRGVCPKKWWVRSDIITVVCKWIGIGVPAAPAQQILYQIQILGTFVRGFHGLDTHLACSLARLSGEQPVRRFVRFAKNKE